MTLAYFQFWFSANNEHGIHSPFVFNLLMRGLYPADKRWKWRNRKDQFIERLLVYFKPQQLAILTRTNQEQIPQQEMARVPVVVFEKESDTVYDALLFDGEDTTTWPTVEQVAKSIHNDSLWIIDRRSRELSVEKYWLEVVESDEMIVTLDFYYFGVAFKRKEQLKQHFKLRLSPDRVFRLLQV